MGGGELLLDVLETDDGVDHAGVCHPGPLQTLQLFIPSPHLPKITRNGLRQLPLALLRGLSQLLLVLSDLLLVEAAVLLQLAVLLLQQEDLPGR
jgi:hypothetical protein